MEGTEQVERRREESPKEMLGETAGIKWHLGGYQILVQSQLVKNMKAILMMSPSNEGDVVPAGHCLSPSLITGTGLNSIELLTQRIPWKSPNILKLLARQQVALCKLSLKSQCRRQHRHNTLNIQRLRSLHPYILANYLESHNMKFFLL